MKPKEITRKNPLILASDSQRRKMLLSQLGIPFRQISSNALEDQQTGDPLKDACLIARVKVAAVQEMKPSSWILGADTIVVLEEKIMGKPSHYEDARAMLRSLSGRTHRVITGFCIAAPGGQEMHLQAVTTEVRFKGLETEEIDSYVATGEPFGKAGAYAIQGIGAFMVEGIAGSYTNVVGLPLCELVKAFLASGALSRYPLST
ncbi:MAG: septum formation protein Maf [Desulfobacteraceae bacterium]|jgi:septum formation protein|nr:MAG: septum formation protein Maf [Desulfobacteraceae bacterium]